MKVPARGYVSACTRCIIDMLLSVFPVYPFQACDFILLLSAALEGGVCWLYLKN